MKIGKLIGRIALGALALSAIPYQVIKNEETGAVEIRSLLWGWRKTPRGEGETEDHYSFAIPPSGLDDAAEAEAGEPAEEPLAEEPAEDCCAPDGEPAIPSDL